MRSRNIKPGFFKNEDLSGISLYARLLFIGLWCMADREGRLEKRPLRIKAEIFPYDTLDINGELTVLERCNFIQTYIVNGKEYILIPAFLVHQRPHHTEAQSKLPCISDGCIVTLDSPLNNREYPPDSLIPDSLIPDSLMQVKPVKKPSRPAQQETLENWLTELKSNEAYKSINIEKEYGKMSAWCTLKKKQPSKLRFLNWLNRIDAPLDNIPTVKKPKVFCNIRQAWVDDI